MSNYALIDSDGLIVNRIVLDDTGAWEVPEGHSIVEETDAAINIGGTYIDGVYTPPPEPPAPPMPPRSEPTPPATAILFDHENRIRAFEGQPPLTLGDFTAKMGS